MNSWSKTKYTEKSPPKVGITYRSHAPMPVTNHLYLNLTPTKKMISIYPSERYRSEFPIIFAKHFSEEKLEYAKIDDDPYGAIRDLNINDIKIFNKLINLFMELNRRFGEVLTQPLINELRQLAEMPYSEIHNFKHLVPNTPYFEAHVNPKYKESYQLSKVCERIDLTIAELKKEIIKPLRQGEDPNQLDTNKFTQPLTMIVRRLEKEATFKEKQKILRIFIVIYGGNPFLRNNNYYISAFGECVANSYPETGNIILSLMNHPQKAPISKVKSITVTSQKGRVDIRLEFDDKTVFLAQMKRSTHITEAEHKALYPIFDKTFKDPGAKKYNQAFRDPNTVVTIFYHNNVVIGSTLVEKVQAGNTKHTTVHSIYGFLKPEFLGYKFVPFFAFAPTFCLPWFLRQKDIWGYGGAATYQGFNLIGASLPNAEQPEVPSVLYFPRHRSDNVEKLLEYQILPFANGDAKITSRDGYWLVSESEAMLPVVPSKNIEFNHDEAFFVEELIAGRNGYVPLVFQANNANNVNAWSASVSKTGIAAIPVNRELAAGMFESGVAECFVAEKDVITHPKTPALFERIYPSITSFWEEISRNRKMLADEKALDLQSQGPIPPPSLPKANKAAQPATSIQPANQTLPVAKAAM